MPGATEPPLSAVATEEAPSTNISGQTLRNHACINVGKEGYDPYGDLLTQVIDGVDVMDGTTNIGGVVVVAPPTGSRNEKAAGLSRFCIAFPA